MARDASHIGNIPAQFEEAAYAVMAQIMEMEVLDTE